MDWLAPIIEVVKLVGRPLLRYLKYQIKYNDYLKKFNDMKDELCNQKAEIESRRESALQSAPYHIPTPALQNWLKGAEDFIRRQDVDSEVNSWGYLSCCCRAVILQERKQELKEIYDRGAAFTNECLVIEDHSRKLNYYVQNFEELKKKLQCKLVDIGSTLQVQLVWGKLEKEEVKYWREKVEELTGPIAEGIEDKIRGHVSHSSLDDSLVMLLRENIQKMERKCKEGSRLPVCLVNDDSSASVVELRVSELQGSKAVKANILACLKGEEVTKLGVWGMGGVGKTTIMKHVHNELLKENKFKKIIWVTVSRNCNDYHLQERIALKLKGKPEEHEDIANRSAVLSKMHEDIANRPAVLSKMLDIANRPAVLSKMLEEWKPYLLILDDVWSSFKLEDVGIPEPNITNGCKLVLTTRSNEIIRAMDCTRIKVETLSREEALKLFLEKVANTVLSDHGGIKKDLESTLKGIVDECDGLPLAIATVAGSLKGISEPRLWSAALNQLRGYKKNVAGTNDDDAFKVLKFSYDHLKDPKIQYCFLYCALYPEDYNILEEQIIEYWIDEGFIDEIEGRQAMKNEGLRILRKLEDNSLLEFIEDEDGLDCVRMHDLIRDMALHITRTSPRFLVEAGKALRELPGKIKCTENVEKVSLMCNYIEEIPSSMASSTCARLTTLLMAHNNLSTIPESVFEHMLELKILDLSFNWRLNSLPNSVSKLVKLTTLLLESTSLERVPSLSNPGSLKRLNLRGTKIKEVPESMGMLTNLECLALCGSDFYDILETDEIADGVFSNFSKLHELFVDWSNIELKGEVVGKLMKLEVFHGWFRTVNDMRIFLKCQPSRLSSYFITVESNFKVNYGGLYINLAVKMLPRYKKIMAFSGTSIIGENMLFLSVQVLYIEACEDIRSLNDFSAIKDGTVTDLRRCVIVDCDGMVSVLSSWINNPIVQTLEFLYLFNLHKLDGLFGAEIIANSLLPRGIFSSLKEVHIDGCKKIKKLFPSWKLVEYLQILEKIDVKDCEEMEEIIGSDPEEEGEEGDIINLILPKLKDLTLVDLPALKSICSRRAVMVCDSLGLIWINNCKGPRGIPLYLPLLDNTQPSLPPSLKQIIAFSHVIFSSLKEVHIKGCKKIKKLFPSWKLVEYLQILEKIDVRDCEEMEEIIGSDPEEEGEEGDIINLILPKLKDLTLVDLPALKSICSRRAAMVCDSLEEIWISNCKGLRGIPLYLPLLDNTQPSLPPSLKQITAFSHVIFSSLKKVHIKGCKKIKKLFPSWKLVEYLQSLEEIFVKNFEEMEEIIASDLEEEGEERGDIIKKLILPKLTRLTLWSLPSLKSICSRRAVMVCDSLEEIEIFNCKGLRRIPLYLPLLDNAQPSLPPSLRRMNVYPRERWESLEWDHPNAKDVLRPLLPWASKSEKLESKDYTED